MELWEMMSGGTNDFTVLVHANEEDAWTGFFRPNGQPKQWAKRPSVTPFVDKKRKKQKPQADIGHLTPGTMLLNENAYAVLGDFLNQYGELLPVDCLGETKYYFNVTNLISCIDYENSTKTCTAVTKAVFMPNAIPKDAQIFKDPLTVGTRIYLTTEAKSILEKLITPAGLTGLLIYKAGENFYDSRK